MNTEDLAFDDGTNSKVVENFCAIFPRVGISILSDGFIVETIYSSDLSGLMVSSKKGNVRWILKLEAEQKLECLN
jgi:hypothetical protein